jgi:hypothetical protein
LEPSAQFSTFALIVAAKDSAIAENLDFVSHPRKVAAADSFAPRIRMG